MGPSPDFSDFFFSFGQTYSLTTTKIERFTKIDGREMKKKQNNSNQRYFHCFANQRNFTESIEVSVFPFGIAMVSMAKIESDLFCVTDVILQFTGYSVLWQ